MPRKTKKLSVEQPASLPVVIQTEHEAKRDTLREAEAAQVEAEAEYDKRFEALALAYQAKVLAEFKAENAGPKLDQVVAYIEKLDKASAGLDALAEDLDNKMSGYLYERLPMGAVLDVQAKIDELQDEIAMLSPVPTGCNELVKAYRRALSAKLFGQR